MQQKAFQGQQISRLGMGNMRLPLTEDGQIDQKKTQALLEYAYHHGVNYFDTAYSYHNGASESVLGAIMKQFPRERWYLATKMPGHEFNPQLNPPRIFETQLQRCQTDYFDFYLLHNVYEKSVSVYTDPTLRIVDYLLEEKQKGRIRHLGFSSHATPATLRQFLDRYDGVFEFVQIQLNYVDWTLQDAAEKYQLLTERNLPIIVMEPCRGGKLAALDAASQARLRALRPNASIASWAFRFLQSLPNVQVVLSGMNSLAQLQDNIETFSTDAPLLDSERQVLFEIAEKMMNLLPCTGCRYCCSHCPQGLDIPYLLRLYSDAATRATMTPGMLVDALPEEKRPQSCLSCGACAQVCPQNIDIPAVMHQFSDILAHSVHWEDICRERAKLHAN